MPVLHNKASVANECTLLARTIRRWIIEQSLASNVGHIGSSLSVVEIMAALWGGVIRAPGTQQSGRDRFLMCKGHAALALYCAMRWKGLIGEEEFTTYCHDGSALGGHPLHSLPGIELSTGSLGQGLSVACGIAYGLRYSESPSKVFALISDGECNEGQVWEAAMFAAHHGLSNLWVVVDRNESQCMGKSEEILRMDLPAIWAAFGWHTVVVDGHDVGQLLDAFEGDAAGRPVALIASTVLGKGVSFMENRFEWHYRNLTPDEARDALREIEAAGDR